MSGELAYMLRSNVPRFRGSPADQDPERNTLDGWFWILSSTPICLYSSTRTCSTCSRVLLPVVVRIVSDARTPPFERIPSDPLAQPALSGSSFAFLGSYPSCVPVYFAHPCEYPDVPGLAFPKSSLSMIGCFGVAQRSALRIAMSPSTGCTLFGSVMSLFCAVLISIRSTDGLGVRTSLIADSFSRSGVWDSRMFHIPWTSPALSCAIATSLAGTLLKMILSRYGL